MSEGFTVDNRTAALLTWLRGPLGVEGNAAVLRKAIALASIVAELAGSDGAVTISGQVLKVRVLFE